MGKVICTCKVKALELIALNSLFVFPQAAAVPQLFPSGVDFSRAAFQRCWFSFRSKEQCSGFLREK